MFTCWASAWCREATMIQIAVQRAWQSVETIRSFQVMFLLNWWESHRSWGFPILMHQTLRVDLESQDTTRDMGICPFRRLNPNKRTQKGAEWSRIFQNKFNTRDFIFRIKQCFYGPNPQVLGISFGAAETQGPPSVVVGKHNRSLHGDVFWVATQLYTFRDFCFLTLDPPLQNEVEGLSCTKSSTLSYEIQYYRPLIAHQYSIMNR